MKLLELAGVLGWGALGGLVAAAVTYVAGLVTIALRMRRWESGEIEYWPTVPAVILGAVLGITFGLWRLLP